MDESPALSDRAATARSTRCLEERAERPPCSQGRSRTTRCSERFCRMKTNVERRSCGSTTRCFATAFCTAPSHTLPSLEGVACWLPPGQTELTIGRIMRSGLLAMPLRMGPAAFARFSAYIDYSSELRRQKSPDSYWYLWALGVDPPYQGQGVGGRLIRPVLEAGRRFRNRLLSGDRKREESRFLRETRFSGRRLKEESPDSICRRGRWSANRRVRAEGMSRTSGVPRASARRWPGRRHPSRHMRADRRHGRVNAKA